MTSSDRIAGKRDQLVDKVQREIRPEQGRSEADRRLDGYARCHESNTQLNKLERGRQQGGFQIVSREF